MKKQKLSVGADDSTVYTDSVRSKASTEIMHVCPKVEEDNPEAPMPERENDYNE